MWFHKMYIEHYSVLQEHAQNKHMFSKEYQIFLNNKATRHLCTKLPIHMGYCSHISGN